MIREIGVRLYLVCVVPWCHNIMAIDAFGARLLTLVIAGSIVLSAGAPLADSRSTPIFPIEFEQSGSSWVARGPGYVLALKGGNAILAASDTRGRTGSLRMEVVGARKDPVGVPEREVPGRRNYLTGADPARWRRNVRLWEQVRFAGVLDGVDVVYHGGGRRFEYDLVIAPGVNARTIGISFSGPEELTLDKSGDLIMRTAAGDVIQRRPVAYQMEGGERREVTAEFRLDGSRVGFGVGAYDHSKALIIDPLIDYDTWFPGTVAAVAVDGSGSAYIAGEVYSPVLPATSGAYQQAPSGTPTSASPRQYVAKFSPDGSTLVYCTYLGGSGTDTAIALALDASDNLVIGGVTSSDDFPLTAGSYISKTTAFNLLLTPMTFVSKLSADGSSLLWSTLLPSPGITDLGLDSSGNVFALCTPLGEGAPPTTPNAIATGNAYRWLSELDPSGARLLYGTWVPGVQATSISGLMAIRQDGTVWIAGTAVGFNMLMAGNCGPPGSSASPVVLIGINSNSSRAIANYAIGGSAPSYGTAVQFDANGNIYLAGMTCAPDFPGIDQSVVNQYDIAGFVVKLAAGTDARLWTATVMDLMVQPLQMATAPLGNMAILVPTEPVSQDVSNPPEVLYYFDSSGNQIWSTQNTGPIGPALAIDSQNRIYVGSNFGGTAGAWESAQAHPLPPAIGGQPSQGLMRILPTGGSIVVMPETVTISPYGPGSASVFSTGGTTLPQPFTVSTTTPWLSLRISSPSGPATANGITVPLPNWSGGEEWTIWVSASVSSPGTYQGSFTVTSPAFANSPLEVPVNVVIPPFGSPTVVPPEIVIYGVGTGAVLGDAFSRSGGYVPATAVVTSSTSWITPILGGVNAFIDDSSLPTGVNRGQITVTIPGDPNSPYPVTVIVIENAFFNDEFPISASLAVAPAVLSLLAEPGDAPKRASVGIWAPNIQRESFTAGSEAPWLTVSPLTGSTPSILSVTADPRGLQPGAYSTHIDIASSQAVNGGARIPVTLTIQNDVAFNVDPAAIAFRVPPIAGAPTSVQLNVTSAQPTSYQIEGASSSCLTGMTGMTPDQPYLNLGSCGVGNLVFTSSAGAVREVPVTLMLPELYPLINPGGVVNGATFAPGPVAPGSIVSIFGIDLASSVYVAGSAPLPTPGGPLLFSGWLFPLPLSDDPGVYYQSQTQWNIQLPSALTSGTYWLTIGPEYPNGATSAPAAFTVAAIAPYIFTWGSNHGAVLNVDYSLNAPDSPAAAGAPIMVYLTGQGAVNPPVPTRQTAPSSPLSYTAANTTATIDGAPATVSFSGLAPGYVGLGQVNVSIPDGLLAGQHKLVINIGGVNTNEVFFDAK